MKRAHIVFACVLAACQGKTSAPKAQPNPQVAQAEAPPSPSPSAARPVAAPPDLSRASMVALPHDKLLFWTPQWARVRAEDGSFTALEFPPGTHLVEASAQGLLAATTDQKPDGSVFTVAVAFDAEGKERGRWSVPEQTRALAFRDQTPLLLTARGMVALAPNGGFAAPVPYGSGFPLPIRAAARPYWFAQGEKLTTCLGNIPTESYSVASACERAGEGGYRVTVPFYEAHACGAHLVLLTGPRSERLQVRDLSTGKLAKEHVFPARPDALACVDRELVVGMPHAIERFVLPSLAPLARLELPRDDQLRDLVISEKRIAYRLAGKADEVLFVAR
jgi:hypothetical protein